MQQINILTNGKRNESKICDVNLIRVNLFEYTRLIKVTVHDFGECAKFSHT